MKLTSLVLFLFLCNKFLAQTEQELAFGSYFGGAGIDIAYDIEHSSNGVTYFVGFTQSLSNISTIGSHQENYGGNGDGYIVAIDSMNSIIWSTYFGGENDDYIHGITCLSDNSIIITGRTSSTSNIATEGSHQDTLFSLGYDFFVSRFNEEGILIWSTYFGGSGNDIANSIVADDQDNIYVVGKSKSNNLATENVHQDSLYNSNSDGLIVKFDSSGELQWCSYYGGEGIDEFHDVDLNSENELKIIGFTNSEVGISTELSHQATLSGSYDGFIVSMDESSNRLWATYYGGNGYDVGYSIKCDESDRIIVSGLAGSDNNISTPGSHKENLEGTDSFLASFLDDGNINWGTYFGGESFESGPATIDVYETDIYLTGRTASDTGISYGNPYKEFSSVPDVEDFYLYPDIYITKFNTLGEQVWGTYYGGVEVDYSKNIKVISENRLAIIGETKSEEEMTTDDAFQPDNPGTDFTSCIYAVFDINIEVGISEYSTINTSVYPNPSNGEIKIISDYNSGPADLMIYGMDGRIVYSSTYYFGDQLNLDLRSGSYVLKIVTDEGFSTSILSIVN